MEHDGEGKHEVGHVAHSDGVIEDRVVEDAEVRDEIGEDVVELVIAEEEETEEAGGQEHHDAPLG
jgi:hypothetical protein